MAEFSVSFHGGTHTSISHNNRKHTSGNKDIDVSESDNNKYYVQRDIREVYQEIFGEAVAEYNNKQKRSDRKIKDYYEKILNDKKTNHQRELIVAIGKADDGLDKKTKIDALDLYADKFIKENPNLAVYNMVLHVDEANPHLHINYVPYFESKRGLKKRVGQDKALNQQGIEGKPLEVFKNWRDSQTKTVEACFNIKYQRYLQQAKGYSILDSRKKLPKRMKVGSHKYMAVEEYKDYKETLKELELELKKVDKELSQKKEELKNTTKSEFFKLKEENTELKNENKVSKERERALRTILSTVGVVVNELPYNLSNQIKIACSDIFLRYKAKGQLENIDLPEFLQSDKYKQFINKPIEIKPQKVDISDFSKNTTGRLPKR